MSVMEENNSQSDISSLVKEYDRIQCPLQKQKKKDMVMTQRQFL